MIRSLWSHTDAGSNSFVCDVNNVFSPSNLGHDCSQGLDFQGELERVMFGDDQDSSSSADFILADLVSICSTPDEVTPDDDGGFARADTSGDALPNATLSRPPPQGDDPLERGCGQGRPSFADFRLTGGFGPGTSVGVVPSLHYVQEMSDIIQGLQGPMDLPAPTCTFDLHCPPVGRLSPQTAVTVASSMEIQNNKARKESGAAKCAGKWPASSSPFVDLSEFVSPQLVSSRHLSAEQLACLGLKHYPFCETTHGGASSASAALGMPSTTGLTNPRINVEEQLRQFPVTFVSVQQGGDPAGSPDPAKVSSYRTSFPTARLPWKSANPKLLPHHSDPAPSDAGPKGMPVNPLAPATPERQRKRKTHPQKQLDYQETADGSGYAPPACPKKLQKLGPVPESDYVFEQVRLMQTHFVGIQGGNGNSGVGGNRSSILVPRPRGVANRGGHVARERRRRDLMNTLYQNLESLLPALHCRRDRRLIVEDTKLYVKELEQRLSDLKNTRRDCQTVLEAAPVAKQGLQRGCEALLRSQLCSKLRMGMEAEAVAVPVVGIKTSPLTGLADSSMAEDLNVEVVGHQNDQQRDVLIFAHCSTSSGAKLLRSLLRATEKLRLDVSQCSMYKFSQFFFCSAVCKLQEHALKTSSISSQKLMQEMVTMLSPSDGGSTEDLILEEDYSHKT